MLKGIVLSLVALCLSQQLFPQQKFHEIIEENDTVQYELSYPSIDSLKVGGLIAYFKDKPLQAAIHKKYYLGKQSGVTRTYFINGSLYEVIIYQNGIREGDYTRYNTLGELIIKAQYKRGVKWGYYINKKEKYQGRYRNGLKHGKWECNVGSPQYYKEFYQEGTLIKKRQIFKNFKLRPTEPQQEKEGEITGKEDSLIIPFQGDTSWYQLVYVSRDSLPHPAMRKAYFLEFPNVLAHTKYIYNGYVNGMYKIYYPSGKLYLFANYTAGFLDGAWKQYNEKGNLSVKGRYLDGVKIGKWQYYIGTSNYRKEKYRSGVLRN